MWREKKSFRDPQIERKLLMLSRQTNINFMMGLSREKDISYVGDTETDERNDLERNLYKCNMQERMSVDFFI